MLAYGHGLGAVPLWVKRVSGPEQAPRVRTGGHEHAVAAGSRRQVGDAVPNRVNVDAGAEVTFNGGLLGAAGNVLDREVGPGGMFAMEEGGGDPDFVGDLIARRGARRRIINILLYYVTYLSMSR